MKSYLVFTSAWYRLAVFLLMPIALIGLGLYFILRGTEKKNSGTLPFFRGCAMMKKTRKGADCDDDQLSASGRLFPTDDY